MKNTPNLQLVAKLAHGITSYLVVASALLLVSPLISNASTVTINFDDVSAGPSGVDPTAYLATYGVTLSGVAPSVPIIYSDLAFYGVGVVAASSGHNFLLQQSAVNGGNFTLNFGTALTDVQFTRIRNITYNLVGEWSATAYSGATAVGSVGESFGLGGFSPITYNLSGANITSLTFWGNGYGRAGMSSAMIDDLKLTSVPDTFSTLALMGFSLASLVALRRRFVA